MHWGELDTLLIDMPPGTGDVAISLGQLLPRAEVLVVTTPQPAAQQVAVRAADMAQRTGMRLLGAVENMSYLVGTGQGCSAKAAARRWRRRSTCRCSGASRSTRPCVRRPTPASCIVQTDPDAEASRAIRELAERVRATRRGEIVRSLPLVG